ncbi:MAG: hypothetical protein IJJ41_02980 [Clostridia bacterium]|nr:hypothetical protein [Clostridia bacterium]
MEELENKVVTPTEGEAPQEGGKKLSKRKKTVIIVVAVVLVLAIAGACCAFFLSGYFEKKSREEKVQIVDTAFDAKLDQFCTQKVQDEKQAAALIKTLAPHVKIENPQTELKQSEASLFGKEHFYKFQQYHNAIPVEGKYISFWADESGKVYNTISNVIPTYGFSELEEESLEKSNAEGTLPQAQYDYKQVLESYCKKNLPKGTKVQRIEEPSVENRAFRSNSKELVVTYRLYVATNRGAYHAVLAAESGELLAFKEAKAYAQQTYRLPGNAGEQSFEAVKLGKENVLSYVSKSGCEITFLNAADSQPIVWTDSLDKNIVDVAAAVQKVYRGYQALLQRDSFDNHQGKITVYIDTKAASDSAQAYYTSSPEGPAIYLNCTEDAVPEDVIAHEFAHGIIAYTAGLQNSASNRQAQEVSEAVADVLAELVEQQLSGTEKPDWVMGDNLRSLKAPQAFKYTACYYEITGQKCPIYEKTGKHSANDSYTKDKQNCLVRHAYPYEYFGAGYYKSNAPQHNSTVLSRTAYLMWNGINGNKDLKVDAQSLSTLWYKTLLSLPADADIEKTLTVLRMSAEGMQAQGQLSLGQVKCLYLALNLAGLNENHAVTYAKDSTVSVLFEDGSACDSYDVRISQLAHDQTQLKTLLEQYGNLAEAPGKEVLKQSVSDAAPFKLTLGAGIYKIKINDGDASGSKTTFEKVFCITSDAQDAYAFRQIKIKTDFQSPDKLFTASDDAVQSFVSMLETTEVYWVESGKVDFAKLPQEDLIPTYLFGFSGGMYSYLYGTKFESPLEVSLDADKADFILRHVFNTVPDHKLQKQTVYYQKDSLILKNDPTGYEKADEYILDACEHLENGKYNITVHHLWQDPLGDSITYLYDTTATFTVGLKYDEDLGYYWSFYQVTTAQKDPQLTKPEVLTELIKKHCEAMTTDLATVRQEDGSLIDHVLVAEYDAGVSSSLCYVYHVYDRETLYEKDGKKSLLSKEERYLVKVEPYLGFAYIVKADGKAQTPQEKDFIWIK